jgi:hypothetical protein
MWRNARALHGPTRSRTGVRDVPGRSGCDRARGWAVEHLQPLRASPSLMGAVRLFRSRGYPLIPSGPRCVQRGPRRGMAMAAGRGVVNSGPGRLRCEYAHACIVAAFANACARPSRFQLVGRSAHDLAPNQMTSSAGPSVPFGSNRHRGVGVAADEDDRKVGLGPHKCKSYQFTGFSKS